MNARIVTLSLIDLALVALLAGAPAGAQEKPDPAQKANRVTVGTQTTAQQGNGVSLLPPLSLDAIARSAATSDAADKGQKGKRTGPADGTGNAYRKGQGNGNGNAQGKGKGNGQGKGKGNGQGKGKGNGRGRGQYGARDGSGNSGSRPMDGTGYGARSGQGSCDGSGRGARRGGGRGGRH